MTDENGNGGGAAREDGQDLAAENSRLRDELRRTRAEAALRDALLARGALPETCGLLAGSVRTEALALDEGGALLDPDGVIAPLRARYGLLFRESAEIPAPPLHPPAADSPALTPADLRRMSAEEINAQWSAVRDALRTR